MELARNDEVRLALINRASSIRIGLTTYVDDKKFKIVSPGQAQLAARMAQQAADSTGSTLVLRPGKTEAVLKEARVRGPILGANQPTEEIPGIHLR